MRIVIKTLALWAFYTSVVFFVVSLTGCAALEGLLTETRDITATGEANAEITATLTIIDDFVDDPWKYIVATLLGYGACILRRWYKKKQGSKTT